MENKTWDNYDILRMKTLYIEPYQNFTCFYKKGVDALNKLQNSYSKGKNKKVKM